MKACAFFGHHDVDVEQYREKLSEMISGLIENEGVTQFYSCFRGKFDILCSGILGELKAKYPQIRSTMVFYYIPAASDPDYKFVLPECFDDSVYLLERRVPPRYAIIETNKCIIDRSDFIIAGVMCHFGGAYTALQYAQRKKKTILNVYGDFDI